jgi:pimeloyl-ACP methyl ester carboxylesterase
MSRTSRYLVCEGRELHVCTWGDPSLPALIAWHGLARSGRDMDEIAARLESRHFVVCPDTIGRGLSQWSPEPIAEYRLDFYARLATALLEQLGLAEVDWLGTSMGGAIGIVAAAGPLRGRIRRLILNDIGPELNPVAIARIREYAGRPPVFDRLTELEAFFREVYRPYGWLSDAQWRRLAETSMRRLPNGQITPHYDPAIAGQFMHHPGDYDRWAEWDSLTLPVLCLRGVDSDLLLPEACEAMKRRGPRAQVIEVPGCGHAPALNVPSQFELVERFLAGETVAA